ncbi:MAG: hypothetical protein EA378_05625 [Phycisphaerales bacterium]|nr:MAG: hypothetical protein EA378_05625 [Phycisphaerales bacterium]
MLALQLRDPAGLADGWAPLDGTNIDTRVHFVEPNTTGGYDCEIVLHPESLDAEHIMAIVEFQMLGQDSELTMQLGNGVIRTAAEALILPDGWRALPVFAVRDNPGEPVNAGIADLLFMTYRNVEVRLIGASDAGMVGDLNFDGTIDWADLDIVIQNLGTVGALAPYEGDVNQDGVVDIEDVNQTIEAILENL